MATEKHNKKEESMTTAEAGKLGGDTVRDERGTKFYSEIGQKQGKENNPGNFANDRAKASEAGRVGGQSRGGHH